VKKENGMGEKKKVEVALGMGRWKGVEERSMGLGLETRGSRRRVQIFCESTCRSGSSVVVS
jgi:hypothetical protein